MMGVFGAIIRACGSMLRSFGWKHLLLVIAAHFSISYFSLLAIGEKHLFAPFIYWYATTTTTIGYGDLFPQTQMGRWFVAIWVMYGGVALIGASLGKLTTTIIDIWRASMKGLSNYKHLKDHTVVVGYNKEHTDQVIKLLLMDTTSNDAQIVLVDDSLEENPYHHLGVGFVKGDKITSVELDRANIGLAERILISSRSDAETLALVMLVKTVEPKGHLVAQFDSSQYSILAQKYVQGIECTTNLSSEMIVRASQDPGTTEIINELLSLGEGPTQYCQKINRKLLMPFSELQHRMKSRCDITVIAWRPKGQDKPIVNPTAEMLLVEGEVYYIANKRLSEKDFTAMFTD
jgi:voltage-gated potassium channel